MGGVKGLREKEAIKLAFRSYYYKNADKINAPNKIEEREFGYMPFNGSMIRHLKISNEGELRALLVKETPAGVYYSCAYYSDPSAEMESKGWKGADLIFDIDAEDLNLQCREEHELWICIDCGEVGKGLKPKLCKNCSSNKIEEVNWPCRICLDGAKDEVIKLIEILQEDFGVPKSSISVCFSGNIGYHVSVDYDELKELDQNARGEIADYLKGLGMDIEGVLGITRKMRYDEVLERAPSLDEYGWRGRIARGIMGLDIKEVKGVNDVKERFLQIYSKLEFGKLKRIVEGIVKKYGVVLDANVTRDTHRIFRLPKSLHIKTGMAKMPCEDLLSFNPLDDAVVLGDEPMKIFVKYSPKLILKGQEFGPFKNQETVLPTFASIFLIAKGLAKSLK
jgi:DNA primase small subunit